MMKTQKLTILFLFVITMLPLQNILAQAFKLNNQKSSLVVYGTSNIHDWDIKTESYDGAITFEDVSQGTLKALNITVIAESLKSGKNGMDKNTYKALKTDDYKNIRFTLLKVNTITPKGENTYAVEATGNLNIAGKTNAINIEFVVEIANNQVKLVGEKKIKMTDYNIEPPKALFGTITTGDEVIIKFESIFNS
ncbi:polyisoprenoid-binding protein YceI [Jejuia pallidilutea]|uniref:Polyisoprenoid-binding protein YceI n=1 Tax=Jejuia pallidilutea TaxID=504487 RepID=A0A362X2R1_9FLAO|nr:YceI family protein [Jejuia pallidilutea]PQV51148.1 polyisoprenoid-binding protein YceI [Jejuia pallidilutea]